MDMQILNLIALETYQNRYKYQVRLPFVNETQREALHKRLAENLRHDDGIQLPCSMILEGVVINGRCDVIHENTIWELKFTREIKREHYLQLAMYLVSLSPKKKINKTGRLWNIRDNTVFDVSIKPGKEPEFLKQVARTIRKDTCP